MARIKSTSGLGREHEESIVKIYEWDNAWRSRSSGASFHAPIDVTTDNFVIECEATEKKSKSISLRFWREIVEKQHTGKKPLAALRFKLADNQFVDLVVMDAHDHSEYMEELEAYRNEAISVRNNGL